MEKGKRVTKILSGIIMVIAGVLMMTHPRDGYLFVQLFLVISMIFYGIRHLIYYFTMARFKVGGIMTFYKGLLFLDAGIFAMCLDNIPRAYGMLYLIGCMFLSGVIDVLQANQARRLEAGHWRYQLFYGLGKLIIAFSCFFFLDSMRVLTYMYCLGLFHSAASRIVSALRKTKMVFVK